MKPSHYNRRPIMESLYLRENFNYIRENLVKEYANLSVQDVSNITPDMPEEQLKLVCNKLGKTSSEMRDLIHSMNTRINFSNFFG